ncbi:MAG: ski2-like helicase [bacterium ADurb.Bin236]|nr:MAG: ski2-like helicase [bacterium ADurb.Bin236]
MKTGELIRYGFSSSIIDVWEKSGLKALLPVQSMAVRKFDLFGPGNLIVSAPTSSGKTFIGEMAAVRNALENKKVFYCVPLKALAEEKYHDFKRKYDQYGFRVVISTRDRREYDDRINAGEFGIAVVVYEKLQQLLTQNIGLLDEIGIVIIDELQMLADDTRGAELELLLTKLKLYKGNFKILGLSAVMKNCQIVPEWLDAKFLEYFQRPVELRRGILYNGVFHYETFNTGETGQEKLVEPGENDCSGSLAANVKRFAELGEQSLVFLKDKSSTRDIAATFAVKSNLPSADAAIEELAHLEDTSSKHQLVECLQKGVAFHNADMNIEEREVVERHFRAGAIRILCSTSTLAMGVNLPARNVFLETQKWHTNKRFNRPYNAAITKAEFENMAGRAGRLSLEKEFGRAIVVAASEFEFESNMHRYLDNDIEEMGTHLLDSDLGTLVLNIVASGICKTGGSIRNFIRNSLSWYMARKKGTLSDAEFDERIVAVIKNCIQAGLFNHKNKQLEASSLGFACATKGISVESALSIISWLNEARNRATSDLETLYVAARTSDAHNYHINMSTREYRESPYHDMLGSQLGPDARALFRQDIDNSIYRTYERVKEMKVALIMNEWISETPFIDIETKYNTFSGSIQRLAEGISWIVDAITGIAAVMNVGETRVLQFGKLSRRLLVGIEQQGLSLAVLRIKGLNRHQIAKLVKAGIADVETLRARSLDELTGIIPTTLARRIVKRFGSVAPIVKNAAIERPIETPHEPGPALTKASRSSKEKPLFKCRDKFMFDGRVEKKRTYIGINGVQTTMTNRMFEILLRLAVQMKKDGIGWVEKNDLAPDNTTQYLSRARREIEPFLLDGKSEIIENNAFGAYRLSVPPENLIFDTETLACHWMHGIKELSEEVTSLSATG